jgi:Protein of unknown function DUF2617
VCNSFSFAHNNDFTKLLLLITIRGLPVLSVRPKVAELVFQMYSRNLHPELFEVFGVRTISRGDYEATVKITSAGHVVEWRYQGHSLTEVAASATHPLPPVRRIMSHRLRGERQHQLECNGVRYKTDFQLATVAPEVFWTYQHEISLDGIRNGMLHRFDSSGRIALGALSYINIESRNRTFMVRAFHTFPDDYAIVKSTSIFEIG